MTPDLLAVWSLAGMAYQKFGTLFVKQRQFVIEVAAPAKLFLTFVPYVDVNRQYDKP